MLNYIWVMAGGALGTGARYWASGLVARTVGEFFPVATLTVNVTGSFMIGVWWRLYEIFVIQFSDARFSAGRRLAQRKHSI